MAAFGSRGEITRQARGLAVLADVDRLADCTVESGTIYTQPTALTLH